MLSAVVMIVFAGLEIWLGGVTFAALVIVLCALMLWELASITGGALVRRRRTPVVVAVVSAAALGATIAVGPTGIGPALLLIPSVLLALTPRRDRRIASVYGAAVMVAGFGLVALRTDPGTVTILWLLAVVIASDVLGYFAGRMIGGPKFWPAISPKKTWSGTVAGWIGAAAVGAGFVLAGTAGWGLVLLSVAIALAGQFGDIAESWIKRRTGVKDSSSLIPGHGGVMDRFDALVGAIVAVMILKLMLPLPLPVGG
jgi:phosphatidate cytidylyltransferase